jgi:aminodeoxychorismate synthase component I
LKEVPPPAAWEIPRSNFTQPQYLAAVDRIKELIRAGDTYQVNLTQQLSVPLYGDVLPADIFIHLRRSHPAPFAAYLDRESSFVISASPEQFVTIKHAGSVRTIMASPIKGTRPRGTDAAGDEKMRADLLDSEKDRAENTMIVDLMRNDLGRICEFGSVKVDELCRLDVHPTLFHLVSDVSGKLREDVGYSDVIRAAFPCGSITGAPKIRTMEIIDRIETVRRGLSMGAIGCRIAPGIFGNDEIFEMSVAIRTMVVRDGEARFNVGGGITIDSDPEAEYDESMLKAKALLTSLFADQAIAA